MTSLWISLNILACPKFGEWHQSDSDFTLNSDVKQTIKSTAHRSAKFNGFQGRFCWTNSTELLNLISLYSKK